MPNNFCYYTWKHNPITSNLMKLYLRKVDKDIELLIFVATTGRSATTTLSEIFERILGCSSHHEPNPNMNGQIMINRNNDDSRFAKFTYETVKSVNIRRLAKGFKYYVETNHMFIKTFIDYVVDDFPQKVKVIHLVRNPVEVAESITRLNQHPGSNIGNQWWSDYHAPENIIKIADVLDNNNEFKDNFYKSLWYWYEIEARVSFWKQKLPNVPFIYFNVRDISNGEKLCGLMEELKLKYDRNKIVDATNIRANQKNCAKKPSLINRNEATKMNEQFQQMLLSKGYLV